MADSNDKSEAATAVVPGMVISAAAVWLDITGEHARTVIPITRIAARSAAIAMIALVIFILLSFRSVLPPKAGYAYHSLISLLPVNSRSQTPSLLVEHQSLLEPALNPTSGQFYTKIKILRETNGYCHRYLLSFHTGHHARVLAELHHPSHERSHHLLEIGLNSTGHHGTHRVGRTINRLFLHRAQYLWHSLRDHLLGSQMSCLVTTPLHGPGSFRLSLLPGG